MAAGVDRRKLIERSVTEELCKLLDGTDGHGSFQLKKGKPNVVMFVGLQVHGCHCTLDSCRKSYATAASSAACTSTARGLQS